MELQKRVVMTSDGSPTLYIPSIDEHYHSIHGAIQESAHIYIRNALDMVPGPDIRLFEMGFGTGLNACLSCIQAEKRGLNLIYHSVELYPLNYKILTQLLAYYEKAGIFPDLFKKIHDCEWEREVRISEFFTLKKIFCDFTDYIPEAEYDVIYFDAFGPQVRNDMWSADIFLKVSGMMKPGARLSTFSSKGEVKRSMLSAGLLVNPVPGPPGKREIIVASKPST